LGIRNLDIAKIQILIASFQPTSGEIVFPEEILNL